MVAPDSGEKSHLPDPRHERQRSDSNPAVVGEEACRIMAWFLLSSN